SFRLYDLGPSLEFNFLFFNLNSVLPARSSLSKKQSWFKNLKFRQAISLTIDRDAITRLVYRGRGTPLWTPVTPASTFWVNTAIQHQSRSVDRARDLLRSAGFHWNAESDLVDGSGTSVEFSVIVSSSNAQRTQMATLIQADLKEIGIQMHVVPL